MSNNIVPYRTLLWEQAPRTEHQGESGTSWWRTLQLPGLRIRIVEYSAGYLADHWCRKGHIVHCLEGEFVNEQQNGEIHLMKTPAASGLPPGAPDGGRPSGRVLSRSPSRICIVIVDPGGEARLDNRFAAARAGGINPSSRFLPRPTQFDIAHRP